MRNHIYIACSALAILIAPSYAAAVPPCAASTFGSDAVQRSDALHKFFFHVYDATFISADGNWSYDQPAALHLTYFIDTDKASLVERTVKELKRNPDVNAEMLAAFETKLPAAYADITDEDTITALYQPQQGVAFCYNNAPTATLDDPALAMAFMDIWLGRHTSEPALRDTLLGR